jgi:predicted MFS family arabinose efflux permease
VGFVQEAASFAAIQAAPYTPGKRFGFQMSFVASMVVLVLTIVLVVKMLPRKPHPGEGQPDPRERRATA